MKKRTFTLLLALVIAASALSACGLPAPRLVDAGDAFSPVLASGTVYAVYNGADTLAAFLQLTGRRLTVYSAEGEEAAGLACSFNETDGYYYLDGRQSFSVRDRRNALTLIARGGAVFETGSYTLQPAQLPVPEETPVPTETPEPEPAEPSPEPTETPVPEPTEPPVQISAGTAYAIYWDDELDSYMTVDEDTLTMYYPDGFVSYEGGYVYDPAVPALVIDGESYELSRSDDGAVYMSFFRLAEISPDEIPSPDAEPVDPDTEGWVRTALASDGGNTVTALLPPALAERLAGGGSESGVSYTTDSGAFYLSAFLFTGRDMERELESLAPDAEGPLSEEEMFNLYLEGLLEEVGPDFEAQEIELETEIATPKIHGTAWRCANIYGGYTEGRINDLYMFFTGDDSRICMVMVMANAFNDGPDYQGAVEELVYGWLLSIPASLELS